MTCIYGNLNSLQQNYTIEKECNMTIIYKNGDNGTANIMRDVQNN